ncbi:sulfatase, partial [candidate division CSSED10-310 bacterium]
MKQKPDELPSILLISLDTLRADHLGCYGYPRHTSPYLDLWSKEATVFPQAFSQACLTLPSHMTIFTSLYPAAHDVGGKRKLNPQTPTLASILRNKGYQTRAYTGGAQVSKAYGFDQGFDLYSEEDPLLKDWDLSVLDQSILPWINEMNSTGQYFFCFFHTYRIHDPYIPPVPLDRIFDPTYSGPIKTTDLNDSGDYALHSPKRRGNFWKNVNRTDLRDRQHLKALYDGEIYYTDSVIHHLLTKINQNTHPRKYIVVITSDHGEEFQEHNSYLHRNIFDEVIHVPLLFLLPGNKKTTVIKDNLVALVDILPTLLGLLGISPETPTQGKNILAQSPDEKDETRIFSYKLSHKLNQMAIRTNQWKYIKNLLKNREELYDLKHDSQEQIN